MTNNENKNTSNKKKKKRSKLKIVLLSILTLLIIAVGGTYSYIHHIFSKVETKKIDKDNLGVDEDLKAQLKAMGKDDIINIALFGLDKTNNEELGRSDATMILSLDMDNKKVKMISIMRDSYVDIDGHGKDKLNHAHAFGGPELAIKTLNKTFNLNITDFASVDFADMEKIVDYLGGVEIDIKQSEIETANEYIVDLAKLGRTDPQYIEKPGVQNLTGMQALAYTRIRYVGNGDFERTDRQRRVLEALFEKIANTGATEFPALVSNLLPYIQTSFSSGEIIKIGSYMLLNGVTTFEEQRFPLDEDCKDTGEVIDGIWYLPFDKKATTEKLHKYIFEDIKPS
ncbi:LCP family protein [Clostridium frigidicarnis]|uniref:Cell envelope-related function transcriptional attenuator common domain-containing protein n=1 Tax=Clostridium frigidicarnis TaxID=84698 RepID=A0A1I0VYB7_9CLOT|nr:LCP family protein [Clostridium frigidicarnis]SFA81409.1 cell envelope-related function transcriptional attenuator common domain-containing protein [Clostridium frigidicarnis]